MMSIALLAAMIARADAGEVLDEAHRRDQARVIELNRAALRHGGAVRSDPGQAAYRRARARYEAALADADRARAEADAEARDYAAARAAHAAAMARWRAQVAEAEPRR